MLAETCVALRPILADCRIVTERAACFADRDLLDADEVDEAMLLGVDGVVLSELHPGSGAHERIVDVDADETGGGSKAKQTVGVRLSRSGA